MTIGTETQASAGELFCDPAGWADMDTWHQEVAGLRRDHGVVPVTDLPGFSPFWVLTRRADVVAVSRDDTRWRTTPRAVIRPDADAHRIVDAGIPLRSSLVHLHGPDHRDHRAVTSDWFRPAAVAARQPRIDAIADLFVQRMRDLGGSCDFARDIAQPYALRVIMDVYGVPEHDEPLMLELTPGIFGSADPEFLGDATDPAARLLDSAARFAAYFDDLTADQQAHPRDDLATVIANG